MNFFKNKSAEPVKYERVSNLALNNIFYWLDGLQMCDLSIMIRISAAFVDH